MTIKNNLVSKQCHLKQYQFLEVLPIFISDCHDLILILYQVKRSTFCRVLSVSLLPPHTYGKKFQEHFVLFYFLILLSPKALWACQNPQKGGAFPGSIIKSREFWGIA